MLGTLVRDCLSEWEAGPEHLLKFEASERTKNDSFSRHISDCQLTFSAVPA